MTDTLPVSDRAREAAALLVQWHNEAARQWKTPNGTLQFFRTEFPAEARDGVWDNHDVVQAFAAFERDCTAPYREALTPSSDTKAAYIGEVEDTVVQYDEFGDEQYCTRPVSWTATKEIMAMISARAALQHGDSNDAC